MFVLSSIFSRMGKNIGPFVQMDKSEPQPLPFWAKFDEDPNTSKDELVDWAKQTAMKASTYLIINRYQRSRTTNRRPYITLACECGGVVKKYKKPVVDDEEEEVPIKTWGPYKTKKYGCPFKLKGEQMATSEMLIVCAQQEAQP
ncbi:hypothetical protein M9H77_18458 [Catharanthus roseus]|uniref:Uncharacterized protein n=1 Tax=Catharanthus roseus TaxID=4058 RepID=A0ACC0B7I5_CATRO|nr:hypothetical protein M9H77_18458 [Catharanthus roseus]